MAERRSMSGIVVDRVTVRYSGSAALAEFSLDVGAGEVLAILGPSGCGKTTALRVILGFVTPSAGSVRIGGRLVADQGRRGVPPEERGLSVVFQDLALWPHLTVAGNLEFGLTARGVPRPERKTRIDAMLDRVGLAGHERRYPGELSGGERQRVAIARALVLEPQAVLFDEPLSNLDVALRRELLGFLRELLAERKTTSVYVTHDLREATALASRIAVMESGRIVQAGTVEELRAQAGAGFLSTLFEDAIVPEGRAITGKEGRT
jgi:ABC-type Fe3+/spermidine/putrescine transport system ATPase subunit